MVNSTQLLGLVGASLLVACSSREPMDAAPESVGGLELALTVEGYSVNNVEVSITSDDPVVSRVRNVSVSDPNATISLAEHGLPPATYAIGLQATIVDDPSTALDESGIECEGSASGVVVQPGQTTEVNDLVLVCTVDGGKVQVAGGIRINAEAEVAVGPVCRDVIQEAYAGSLRTSVGAAIDLVAVPVAGATVAWSASAGEVSADGKSFTCPDAPQRVTLKALFTGAANCTQEFETEVECAGEPVQLPEAFLSSGCSSIGIPAICSLSQDGADVSVNCNGTVFAGSISDIGEITFGYSQSSAAGSVEVSCAGTVGAEGVVTAACTRVTASPDVNPVTTTCNLLSDYKVFSGKNCIELPPSLASLTLSPQGESDGADVTLSNCELTQGACRFQAECDGGVVFQGTSTATGLNFTRSMTALADAQTPNPTTNNPAPQPAFRAGASVNHTCNVAVAGDNLTGDCSAGGTGSGASAKPATSIYDANGVSSGAATCANLAPEADTVFVLNSCEALKAEIGEPVCAFRQNNCLWELTCSNGVYVAERFDVNSPELAWEMNGASCKASFDAAGNLTGNCALAGQPECALNNIPAVAGGEQCPALPQAAVRSHGCGGPVISCSDQVQHGCNYMAICAFGDPRPLVVVGETSYENERSHFEFNGLGAYSCYVDQANAEEIASGDRAANEWYGQCVNPSGGQCRNNYNPATGSGFRGFRLYFD